MYTFTTLLNDAEGTSKSRGRCFAAKRFLADTWWHARWNTCQSQEDGKGRWQAPKDHLIFDSVVQDATRGLRWKSRREEYRRTMCSHVHTYVRTVKSGAEKASLKASKSHVKLHLGQIELLKSCKKLCQMQSPRRPLFLKGLMIVSMGWDGAWQLNWRFGSNRKKWWFLLHMLRYNLLVNPEGGLFSTKSIPTPLPALVSKNNYLLWHLK